MAWGQEKGADFHISALRACQYEIFDFVPCSLPLKTLILLSFSCFLIRRRGKAGRFFTPVSVGAGSAWTADERSAGSCSAGGREQIGSAAGGKAQNKAQQACGRCFIRNAPFCFSALAENPINFILCQCCAAAGESAMATGVKTSDCVPHVYTAAPRLCACVKISFLTHARIDLRSRRRRRYTYRNRARAW